VLNDLATGVHNGILLKFVDLSTTAPGVSSIVVNRPKMANVKGWLSVKYQSALFIALLYDDPKFRIKSATLLNVLTMGFFIMVFDSKLVLIYYPRHPSSYFLKAIQTLRTSETSTRILSGRYKWRSVDIEQFGQKQSCP
jgi:hypothetical protein